MFTGIVTDIGKVVQLERRGDLRARIMCSYDMSRVDMGASIASDGVAEIVEMRDEGDSTRISLRAPSDLARFIASKGSVALNGTSLTVNEVEGDVFGINFIPHTKEVTTWGDVVVGDRINLEIDTMARYVARLAATVT